MNAIFTFHAVDDILDLIGITPANFEILLHSLQETYSYALTLSAQQQQKAITSNDRVSLTFDDGYASVYETALPIMQQLGHCATIFLTVERTGNIKPMMNRAMLNWKQIRALHDAGHEIGAHTLSHPDLRTLAGQSLYDEIVLPKQMIEDKLGVPVRTFAYPYGHYDSRSADIVAEHYDYAVTTQLRYITPSDMYHLLPRIDTYYLRQPPFNRMVGSGVLPLYLSLRHQLRLLRQHLS